MQLNIGCKIKYFKKKNNLLCEAVNVKILLDTFFFTLSVMYEVMKTILKLDNPEPLFSVIYLC